MSTPAPLAFVLSCARVLMGGGRFATFWQYADSGPNPGDQDEFNGSLQGLKKYVLSLFYQGSDVRKADDGCS